MTKRTCYHCLYAKRSSLARWMRERSGGGWPTMLACINHPDCPGEFRDILPTGSCRDFRARREPAVCATSPEPATERPASSSAPALGRKSEILNPKS